MKRFKYYVDIHNGPCHLTDDLGRACLLAMSEFLSGNTVKVYTAPEGFFEDPNGAIVSYSLNAHWEAIISLVPSDPPDTDNPLTNAPLALHDPYISDDMLRTLVPDQPPAVTRGEINHPESHPDLPGLSRQAGDPLSQLLDWFDHPGSLPPPFLRKQAD